MISGSSRRRRSGTDVIPLTRELWSMILIALESDDTAIRQDVYAMVLTTAPTRWDSDLDDPALLERRLAAARANLVSTPDHFAKWWAAFRSRWKRENGIS